MNALINKLEAAEAEEQSPTTHNDEELFVQPHCLLAELLHIPLLGSVVEELVQYKVIGAANRCLRRARTNQNQTSIENIGNYGISQQQVQEHCCRIPTHIDHLIECPG